jgi:hypothetical protein
MFGKFVTVAALCLGVSLAHADPRAPRTLLVDACGQLRDNALRIWSDEKIVSIREGRGEGVVYCFVAGADKKMKSTFKVDSSRKSDSNDPGREALRVACDQMKKNANGVFGGRKVYFTEDPDIKVVYCLVQKPDNAGLAEVDISDPRFVNTVELLFMSYYGEPLGEGV